jgi:hypothetical protein
MKRNWLVLAGALTPAEISLAKPKGAPPRFGLQVTRPNLLERGFTCAKARERMVNPVAALQGHADELRKLGARRVGVFGSLARGEARADSDVDIYVEFTPA